MFANICQNYEPAVRNWWHRLGQNVTLKFRDGDEVVVRGAEDDYPEANISQSLNQSNVPGAVAKVYV